ncbi:MAG: D-glycero-beta-D-manno-heptose-7-phosphate kinase [Ignavibacteriae bacterium]|nr:D-glycero-beta-D-manno-heptose-7-phosphate kinase [Ignavibacteriota bacterium]
MQNKTIAVVGDLMLDRYFWGSVTRLSPEAPVPVVDIESEQGRLGGAANVAKNIKSLGGNPFLVGVIGNDNSGKQLAEIVRESDFPLEGIVIDNTRPTTVKTRIIANNQHVARIDRESRTDISYTIQNKIVETLLHHINSIAGIIIEDYNKGVVVKTLIKQIIDLANDHKKIIAIDPKFNNFFEYKNVTVFKPNRKEVEEALGTHLKTDEDVLSAGKELLLKLQAENILLTRGPQGMTLFESNGHIRHVPTKARNVADVSGAGDTVIATMTLAMCGGASVSEASVLANFAGGIVVGYVGIVPIQTEELMTTILSDSDHLPKDIS